MSDILLNEKAVVNFIGIRNVAYESLSALFSSESCVYQAGDTSLHLFDGNRLCTFNASKSPEGLVCFGSVLSAYSRQDP